MPFSLPFYKEGQPHRKAQIGDPRPENGHFRGGRQMKGREKNNNKAKGVRIRATDVHATETELGLEVRQVVALW